MKRLEKNLSLPKKILLGSMAVISGFTSLFGGQQNKTNSQEAWDVFYNNSQPNIEQNKERQALPSLSDPNFNSLANNFYWDTPISDDEGNFNSESLRDSGEDDILNPHAQPRDTLTNAYGSGDINQDGNVSPDDLNAYDQGIVNDYADVNGDSLVNETDRSQLESFVYGNGEIASSGHWNTHTNNQDNIAKINWAEAISNIDQTNTIPYHDGSPEERWISGNYATQIYLNSFGYDGDDIPSKYDISKNGRFNIPMYHVSLSDPNTGIGHGMNALFTGTDPTNIFDWALYEPQTDELTQINEAILNNLSEKRIRIFGIQDFHNESDMPYAYNMAIFDIDSSGNSSTFWTRPEMVSNPGQLQTIEPDTTVGINPDNPNTPNGYKLYQNYPNPTNNGTMIKYSLPEQSQISLDLFDLRGRKLETIISGNQPAGDYEIPFNTSNLNSGMYLYQLRTNTGYRDTKKLIINN
jgi:hypothetical protein